MEDLQSLLEKINREGVEKADAEAKKIIDEAKAKADKIDKDALAEAAKAKADAEANARTYAERAAETIRQSARDITIGVKDAVTALLEKLLARDIDTALGASAAQIVTDAIKDLTGPGEIRCGAKLAAALKAQLAANGNFKVVTDDAPGAGFTVKLDGGRVEHDFTAETIAAELARRLRPDLANLLG